MVTAVGTAVAVAIIGVALVAGGWVAVGGAAVLVGGEATATTGSVAVTVVTTRPIAPPSSTSRLRAPITQTAAMATIQIVAMAQIHSGIRRRPRVTLSGK